MNYDSDVLLKSDFEVNLLRSVYVQDKIGGVVLSLIGLEYRCAALLMQEHDLSSFHCLFFPRKDGGLEERRGCLRLFY